MQTDRNLLFGVLALQMNFVGKDALIRAMHAWVLAKERTLAEILLEHAALLPEVAELLEALVQAHLKQHRNDPQASLAALSSVDSAREALAQVRDQDVQTSLASLGIDALKPRPLLAQAADRDSSPAAADPDATRAHDSSAAATTATAGKPREPGLRFRILRPLAKGGLGEVFVAEDSELHREVALKEIQDQHADNQSSRGRFVLEAEITGGLEHPGIVPIYGLGTYGDGRPFYAMRLIKGDNLKAAIEAFHKSGGDFNSLEFRKLLGRFIDVCNAIAYAHSRGVLHRDLKPGNIMLGKFGETLVVDWGLAKVIGTQTQIMSEENGESTLRPSSGSNVAETQAGATIGTPSFMSPEQAQGKLDDLGPATDVYSLGATLFAVLTNHAPVEGELMDVLGKVSRGEIRAPRDVAPHIPKPLEAICRKAMANNPGNRYADAQALAADVEHWLGDQEVSALPDSLFTKFSRWGRRHRAWVQTAVATLGLLFAGSVTSVILINEQKQLAFEQKLAAANLAAQNAELARNELAARQATQDQIRVSTARRLVSDSLVVQETHPVRSVLLAMEAIRSSRDRNEAVIPAVEQRLRSSLQMIGGTPLVAQNDEIKSVSISPNGRWLVTGGADMRARLWDLSSASLAKTPKVLPGKNTFYTNVRGALVISPDGRWLVTADRKSTGASGTAWIWDLNHADPEEEPRILRGQHLDHPLVISIDGRWLVTANAQDASQLWDLKSSDPNAAPRTLRGDDQLTTTEIGADGRVTVSMSISAFGGCPTAAISADGRWLATGHNNKPARLWDLQLSDPAAEGKVIRSQDRGVHRVLISSNSRWLVTTDANPNAQLMDLKNISAAPTELRGAGSTIVALAISADSRWLVTASVIDREARLWNLENPHRALETMILHGHLDNVCSVAISRDGRWLVTGSADKTARLWDLQSLAQNWDNIPYRPRAAQPQVLRGHDGTVTAMAFSPDGRWLVTGSADKTARRWELHTADPNAEPRVLSAREKTQRMIANTPDGRWLVTNGRDNLTLLWDVQGFDTAKEPRVLRGHENAINAAAISPNGRWLVTVDDESARRWDLRSPNPSADQRVVQLKGNVDRVAISPDGRWLAAGRKESTLLWDLQGSVLADAQKVLHGHEGGSSTLAVSPDARWLVLVTDKAAHLWNLNSPDPAADPKELREPSLAITADARWLVNASRRGIAMWDLHRLDPAANPKVLLARDVVFNLASSLDGRWLVTGLWSNTVRMWDLQSSDPSPNSKDLRGHGRINAVAVSPDGRWVVTGSEGSKVQIWDLTDSDAVADPQVLQWHEGRVTFVAISPDSRWVVTSDEYSTLRLWRLQLDDLLETARRVTGRYLTPEERAEHHIEP